MVDKNVKDRVIIVDIFFLLLKEIVISSFASHLHLTFGVTFEDILHLGSGRAN